MLAPIPTPKTFVSDIVSRVKEVGVSGEADITCNRKQRPDGRNQRQFGRAIAVGPMC
jgi:hypothetical protein